MAYQCSSTSRMWQGSLASLAASLLLATPALAQQDEGRESNASAEAPAIIVTGSRIQSSGFTAPTPVTMIGAEEIQAQAATNVADVLNDLPAFRAQSTPATTAIFIGSAGAQTMDLRGIGGTRTLVLVDGRRFVGGTTQGNFTRPAGAVDLNMIPTSLVERVEVVTGGASAAYGSDAVAGVVNLILAKDIQGIRLTAQQGISQRGDASETSLSLGAGKAFAGGRGHVIIGGDYVKNRGVGDCYTRTWCAEEYGPVANPVPQLNGLARQLILPDMRPSVASFNGLIHTGPLAGTEIAPNGNIFRHDYGTYYGAPIFQSGGSIDPQHAFYQFFPLYSPVERYSLYGRADFDVTPDINLFVEASYADIKASNLSSQGRLFLGTAPTIRRDNAYISPQLAAAMDGAGVTSVTLGRITSDFGPQRGETNRNTMRFVGGLTAQLGNGWTADFYYQYGRTKYQQYGYNSLITDNFQRAADAVDQGAFLTGVPNGNIVCRSTLTDPTNPLVQGCLPLNILGQNNYNPNNVGYSFGTAFQSTLLTQHVASASVQGELADLWAGPLAVAAGVEYRVDDVEGTSDPVSTALRFHTNNTGAITGPATKVKEGFVEASLPLATGLSVNGAVRLTDYSTSGSVWSWKAGGVWDPTNWLRLRATRSRDIRAPNFFELNNPRSASFAFLTDPQNGGVSSLTQIFGGGNPALKPEVGNTLTAGAVLNFGWLRLSADYFDIKISGAIATVGAQVIVDSCSNGASEFCALITRNSANALARVESAALNLNTIKTRGIDVEALIRKPLGSGDISLRTVGTFVFDLITVDTVRAIDYAGQNGFPVSGQSGLPNFEGSATLGWENEHLGGSMRVRYISAGKYDNTKIAPGDAGYSATAVNSININHVPAYAYVDLNAHLNVFENGKRRFQLFGAINNLLDQNPPNRIPSSFGVTNPALYDVIGRNFRIGVRADF
ncbi:outer membrane receptor protein involved in Fe transport [Sphingobium sp. B1D7B]|uniref:TonB-dependent receptor domain-containing protein n=1 Tax=unclassified Sphingobium TaxID=2611147 RepID=UPI00222551CF|nr:MULTISPECIES: TonB-dependent receptor [unclassified Sphingobium]MCW2392648.1 outer membrane receptor protein involved in Fe transport [Sphingobium sp. B11D3A]MCW2404343.1 outer membrane receptor protein involved in Fe transport [Sphingobium sp. B1D7B]